MKHREGEDMPWCPKCKYEYKKGISICADCGEELVESLDPDKKNLELEQEFDEDEQIEDFDESEYGPISLLGGLKSIQSNRATTVYQKNEDKAEEFKSSAYVLVFVGILGVIALILVHFGIIPIEFGNELMIDIVMGGLFIAFIIFGILSFQSAKKYEVDAIEENSLTDEINKWCNENLTRESIDAPLQEVSEESTEELLYFNRTEQMKAMITDKFINLDESFLETVIENFYQKIYEY